MKDTVSQTSGGSEKNRRRFLAYLEKEHLEKEKKSKASNEVTFDVDYEYAILNPFQDMPEKVVDFISDSQILKSNIKI